MFEPAMQIINTIPNFEDRLYITGLLERNYETISALLNERDFLRGQVSLALRSLKFDLHPELPL